jgi:chaperonin GroEL
MKTRIIHTPLEKTMRGVNAVADVVEVTLGPGGNNVGIAKTNPRGEIYERTIIHDGVNVARAVDLKDEAENFGAQVLVEAARKTVDVVGDGTTATICLARAIMKQAAPIIAAGENAQVLQPGLNKGIAKLLVELEKHTTPVKGLEDLIKVATISAEDEYLGKMIGKTLHGVGVDGVVTAEESKSIETTVDHQKGMQIDKGWYHEFFVTNPDRMEATLEHPYILVTDKPINSLVPLAPMLNEFITKAKKLVIISPEISRDALGLFVQNKLEGKMLPLCIKAPSFGKNQKDILQDIAILTGATFITEDAAMELEQVTMKDLGKCESITSTKTDTIIAGGMGKKKLINDRIASIKKGMEEQTSDFDRLKHQERLGKLTNGVVVIHVGGHTEIEMKERRERVIDGIAATKAAMKHGIVPGGETIYLTIREVLDQSILAEKILYKALEQPFRRLVENAGYDGGEKLAGITHQIREGKYKEKTVFHVILGAWCNYESFGIIDPAAVPINALQNGNSVACKLLTMAATIIPDDEKDSLPQLQQ